MIISFGPPPPRLPLMQGVTKRCRLSLLTNSTLLYESQLRGDRGGRGLRVLSQQYSCAHHVTWTPNKLWRSSSIFNMPLWKGYEAGPEAESKEKRGVWDPMLELTIISPYVHSRVDSNTFTMGNPLPELTSQAYAQNPQRNRT
jgi:hypothetical protein